jgi:hypothetical protein
VTKERSLFGQFFFGSNPSRVEREEKVLQYINHRINEDVPLHNVLREPYMQRNCSQVEIDEIINTPELVHAAREHLEQAFGSGEVAPGQRRPTSEEEES